MLPLSRMPGVSSERRLRQGGGRGLRSSFQAHERGYHCVGKRLQARQHIPHLDVDTLSWPALPCAAADRCHVAPVPVSSSSPPLLSPDADADTTTHASRWMPNRWRQPGPVRVTPPRVRRPPAGALVGRTDAACWRWAMNWPSVWLPPSACRSTASRADAPKPVVTPPACREWRNSGSATGDASS